MPTYAPEFEPYSLLTRAERVHLSPSHEVKTLTVGHDRGEGAVGVRPGLLPGARVERVRAPLERGEVDAAVHHGRRGGDRAVRVELPQDGPCRRVEGVEPVVVG